MEQNIHTSDISLQDSPVTQNNPNTLATASVILGIVALLSFFTFTIFPPIILGSLSIILAILSKGASKKMHFTAKTGITISVVALVFNVVTFSFVFGIIFNNFEAIYGMSYEEMSEGMKNGTLDYDDIYENIYNNLYDMMPNETSYLKQ